jgi:hypothetical protein
VVSMLVLRAPKPASYPGKNRPPAVANGM